MDKATEEAAMREAFVEALLDLEESQRDLAEAVERQNQILSVALFTGMVMTGVILYGVYWMEKHNLLSAIKTGGLC